MLRKLVCENGGLVNNWGRSVFTFHYVPNSVLPCPFSQTPLSPMQKSGIFIARIQKGTPLSSIRDTLKRIWGRSIL